MSSNKDNCSPPPLGEGLGVRAAVDNIAIRVQNLSKCYQIYDTPRDRLKQFVMPRMHRIVSSLRKFFPTPERREFCSLDFDAVKAKLKQSVIFDEQNLYASATLNEQGFEYGAIGWKV